MLSASLQFALRFYKRWLSPVLPGSCRFVPTCSEYAAQAIDQHGVLAGGILALWRLLRCQPFGGAGYDPVPMERHRRCNPQQHSCSSSWDVYTSNADRTASRLSADC